jgi:transposase
VIAPSFTKAHSHPKGVFQQLDPGCSEALLAEIGTDMSRFPSAGHLASWAGMCPVNQASAGKRQSGKTRKGSPWLRALLIQAAHAAGRTRQTYLAAQYHRLAARRGKKRAAVAVGHTILVIVYYLRTRHRREEACARPYPYEPAFSDQAGA